jgi:DNA-binding NarL/FixJ family response regulator
VGGRIRYNQTPALRPPASLVEGQGMHTYLLIVVPDAARREWLRRALAPDPDIVIVGAGPDPQEAYLSSSTAHTANTALLDLSAPETSLSSFWFTVHIIYPAAKLVALAQEPVNEAALAFALQAGLHCFATWRDTPDTVRRAVHAAGQGRRFYSTPRLLVAAQTVIHDIETGLSRISYQRKGPAPVAPARLTVLETNLLSY